MIELLMNVQTRRIGSADEYTFLDEVKADAYSVVFAKTGIPSDGVGAVAGTQYLRYLRGDGVICYLPKTSIAYSVTFNKMLAAGLVAGKTITFNGKSVTARLIRGTTLVDPSTLSAANYSGGTYPADEVYSFSEYSRLFMPVVMKSGKSPEGITYGTAAQYSEDDLGISTGTAGAVICAEYNSTNALLHGAAGVDRIYTRGRGTTSTYWGLRPLLIEQ